MFQQDQPKTLQEHGFYRVCTATPKVHLGNPKKNSEEIIRFSQLADRSDAIITLFPELSLTGYSLDDLFQQRSLLEQATLHIETIRKASQGIRTAIVFGAPLIHEGSLYNTAIVICNGKILGVVPKTYIPNYREFYEKRHFVSGGAISRPIDICLHDNKVPFGTKLLFSSKTDTRFKFGIEICEDLWVPSPPSSQLCLAGATIILNLSASNVTIGKAEKRKMLCESQSARGLCAYVYSAAGAGESTNDLAWDGQSLIYEVGQLVSESERFENANELLFGDVDVEMLESERLRTNTFFDNRIQMGANFDFQEVTFEWASEKSELHLEREIFRFPFVPSSAEKYDSLCFEALKIQAHGLKQRLTTSGIEQVVIGVSGGLDSLLALLVAAQSFDDLGLSRKQIIGVSMPGFASSEKTQNAAAKIMTELKITQKLIPINNASQQMLEDLEHPVASGTAQYDVTYENVQAGIRTSLLFRLANKECALVIGTGDLSELALGWCTYGVGDQMSHYNVNCSVPKTLVSHLIRWAAKNQKFGPKVAKVCDEIIKFEISPELIPAVDGKLQSSEDIVGPYELQDFNLYYTIRYGFGPQKIQMLAEQAWSNKTRGSWPPYFGESQKNEYTKDEIEHWSKKFVATFFTQSQFKRTAVPNGPKISSGGSLSPRGDWRMPSDYSF